MNRKAKILLSVMTVSLSALVVPLKGLCENLETEPVAVQAVVKSTVVNDKNLLEEQSETINFEIAKAIEEMNQKMMEIESVTEKKERFIAYKNIIDEYSCVIEPPKTIYDCFKEDELNMFFMVVQAEIGDEYSFEQKCNVASVILNRIDHYKFSNKMFEILTPDQFETINNKRYKNMKISDDTVLACEYVFVFGDTTNGALFFDSNNTLKYKFLFNDGAHNFYGLIEE